MPALVHENNLLDALLADQQRPRTAVERFSAWHERHDGAPHQSRHYQTTIPLAKPGPGEQYAFSVDLDLCSGCKACVSACHSLNGLEENESWRDVGLLFGGVEIPYQQTVTTACHHCADPACANGCPVLAYEKDSATGIVRHLDDQCIGCKYCQLKCPYDVPKYSNRLGIVRKCDMCHSRLAANEAPACVQACPHEAIKITVVQTLDIEDRAARTDAKLVPGAFPSTYTRPSTVYRTTKPIPANAVPADADRLHHEHTHFPLVFMLTWTQASVGGFCALAAASLFVAPETLRIPLAAAFLLGAIGVCGSIAHLGRPLKAWKAFLGWRKSWLSREIIAFNLFLPAASAAVGLAWFPLALPLAAPYLPELVKPYLALALGPLPPFAALAAAAGAGLLTVFTSVMVYADTRRPNWRFPVTAAKFYGTSLVFGSALLPFVLGPWSLIIPAIAIALKLAWEASSLRRALANPAAPDHKSARTAWHLDKPLLKARFALPLLGLALLALATFAHVILPIALLAILLGEMAERALYFRTVTAPKMPGGI